MKKIKVFLYICVILLWLAPVGVQAQEHAGPLAANRAVMHAPAPAKAAKKTTTSLTLPFFEDFTGYDLFPDAGRWVDHQVYINNTMCISPISRGVATFDALNEFGLPWDPSNNGNFRFTDSLTSQPINLAGYTPADSLYLSFYYQPQGMGFYPLANDTFFLYGRIRYGDWVPMWKVPGSAMQPFQQVMVPVTDTLMFYDQFQFRFVNIAALNYSDAIWNLDYIRFDAHRNMFDTAINDIAYSSDPTFLLNDYTSMPYRQFMVNPVGERAPFYYDSVHNNYDIPQPITYGFAARDIATGTVLQTPINNTATLSAQAIQQLSNNAYTTTVPLTSPYGKVVFENKHYIQSSTVTGPSANDTIIKNQVFDNYLAYDDGTAEQSYYLSLFASLPGMISIEYHLNQPDTMKGMAIYFGRTAPLASNKTFAIQVYSALAGVNGAVADHLLYTEDPCFPGFGDTINEFFVYKFTEPVPLPAGTFYAGVMMPAESGSDSLYFGFDRNRIGINHVYYNVLSSWNPSLLHGAVMMRPLLGRDVKSSGITSPQTPVSEKWQIAPNPASDKIHVTYPGDGRATYSITNITGQQVLSGTTTNGTDIDITSLTAGMYFVNIACNGVTGVPKKIVKL